MKTPALARRALDFPSHFFLETRESPSQSWQLFSRDNDREVMDIRFDAAVERMNKPGQSVRLTDASGRVLSYHDNP